MVPLHKRVSSHFERGDRQRGQELYDAEGVRFEIDGDRLLGRADGTDRPSYGVGMDWSRLLEERVLHAFCECQRFADGKPCKHLWATLLALADLPAEDQPPGKDRPKMRKDRPGAWRELTGSTNGHPAGGAERSRTGRRASRGRRRERGSSALDVAAAAWRDQLQSVRQDVERLGAQRGDATPRERQERTWFLVNVPASRRAGDLVLDVFEQRPDAGGKLRRTSLDPRDLGHWLGAPASEGSEKAATIVAALPGEAPGRRGRGRRGNHPVGGDGRLERLRLAGGADSSVLARLASAERLGWWDGRSAAEPSALEWDAGPPWRLALRLQVTATGVARLSGMLERGEETIPLSAAEAVVPLGRNGASAGLVVFTGSLAPIDLSPARDLPWIDLLDEVGEVVVPKEDLGEAVTSLLELPDLPRLETPEGLPLSAERSEPRPRLVLEPYRTPADPDPPLKAELSFAYGDLTVEAGDPRSAFVDSDEGTFVQRDLEGEREALVRLLQLPVRPVQSADGHGLEVDPLELPLVAEPLLAEGWEVAVHGRSLRPASAPSLRIESGIDWFEVKGGVDFAGEPFAMRELLAAASRGDRFVELADGSRGLLPSELIATYDSLGKLAQEESEEGLRFHQSQALLVDALLAATQTEVDGSFARLREKLQTFDRIKPKKEPRSFQGTLRGYQREGLGWLDFLREFGLGGVLADDMGLGKTVQVLALLRAHRTATKTTGLPSLVVAPRSLVYNWIDEAARFTPDLKVVEYHGADREGLKGELGDYDLVVTTYGTLRRDVAFLATVEFDTVILDEAQAIKNPESQTAKASRLLQARHRLALTGTPIENHLGELGSIFEFLNPGLLGRLPKLDVLASGGAPSQQQLALVSKGIRPFILRRTKAQVLEDLPPKTEQVLLCDLTPRQRELYDGLKARYQASLLEQVESKGMGGSTMQVLEALLRLRQIACHPALVDDEWREAGSAKLETLFEQVEEVLEEGHKVIVFSQFTSLLALVRERLDANGVQYAYLDGQTRDRGAVVDRFQTDPECNLFLISLKAGGVGLNLTAAGYVFLLDPWWNPAVEAQAIDRAHRIGQTQPVFAYRMIARDTVEEKILELQRTKKQLAETVLEGEGLPVSELTADDLRMLLA